MNQLSQIIRDRITARVNVVESTGCWEWKASRSGNGYGRINLAGDERPAHRISYLAFIGDIPDGLFICHKCDNPKCVNPDHLFPGTQSDNMNDRYNKKLGANRPGLRPKAPKLTNQYRKLTTDQAIEVRRLASTGMGSRKISQMFNVSRTIVKKIMRGKTYKEAVSKSS